MKRLIFLALALMSLILSVSAAQLNGKWRGEISLGPTKLPLVFNFGQDEGGNAVASMDSPQQNTHDIPLEIRCLTSDSVSVECKNIGAAFSGKINGDRIDGTFSQMGYRFALTLTPEPDLAVRRPQTPQQPFPYAEKDTSFRSTDGTLLAGTLTLPADMQPGRTAVVVMLTGSGPQNRDEEIFEHRPFAVIADFLARNGIASFRFDDRGVASSQGDFNKATIETFANDARSAFRFVKGMPEFGRAGLLGHSEGGTLAVMLAAKEHPDFIVSLAGMVVPAKETLLAQNIRGLEQAGISGAAKADSEKLISLVFDEVIRQYHSGVSLPIDVEALCKANSLEVPPVVVESIKRNASARNGYFDSLLSLDPTEALKQITCPVLAINGTKDVQVGADANLGAFAKYAGGAEIRKMEGLNHLMQHAATGEIAEYGSITETISPEVLELIRAFISRQ